MSKQLFTSLLLLVSLAVPGFCKSAGAGPRSMVLSGDEAGGNVQEVLRRVKWHTNLNSALREAQRKNKMVLMDSHDWQNPRTVATPQRRHAAP